MDEIDKRQMVKRYAALKKRKAELDAEMNELRERIIAYCEEHRLSELEAGSVKVKLIVQDRKEYDDAKLFEALPDPALWKLVSKADSAKIAGLIKLNVLPAEAIQGTYAARRITLLQVDRA